MIGIDLATKNCGFYFSENMYFTKGVINTSSDTSILNFAGELADIVRSEVCYVDFHFNEGYLPGSKRQASIKSFLAGVILEASHRTTFVSPKELRKFFGLNAKAKKQEMYSLFPEIEGNEHEKDAFLLWYYGGHCEL